MARGGAWRASDRQCEERRLTLHNGSSTRRMQKCLFASILTVKSVLAMSIPSSSSLELRRFAAQDTDALLEIFSHNLEEEWTKYHDAKHLPNAKQYIQECLSFKSDLRNIQECYFQNGGYFWVLSDSHPQNVVHGMTGLQVQKDKHTGEL
jgi:hypothetical protein